MATGTFQLYDEGKRRTISGEVQLGTDTLTMALLTDAYSPDTSAHTTFGDISANEVADADYAQQSLSGVSVTLSGSTVLFDADTISFGTDVSIEAKYAVVMSGVGDSTDPLIAYVDLNTDGASETLRSVASTFEIRLPNGIYEAT